MRGFWYVNCRVCGQGRLFVHLRSDTGSLILECEECYAAWNTPEQAAADEGGFLAIEIPTVCATAGQIEAAGWTRYGFREALD